MRYTGIKCTPEELKELMHLAKTAANTPVIALSMAHGIQRGGFAGEAQDRVLRRTHEIALEHGLPEIAGYYGLTSDGEFVQT